MKRFAALLLSLLAAIAIGGCGGQPQAEPVGDAVEEEQAEQVDRGELKRAIDEASQMDLGGYTDESAQAVRDALSDARAMLGKSGATQEEIDGAIEDLRSAMDGLEEYPEEDKSQLNAAIDEASGLSSSDYDGSSYSKLSAALTDARGVQSNRRASRDEIDAATQSLRDAVDSLQPAPTKSQLNAVAMARDYIDYSAFSRQGLIDQLVYEGFPESDAAYGADHCGADWNAQAARMAQEYLDYKPFSRAGLIDQLEFEGFSYDQAVYGVDQAGL